MGPETVYGQGCVDACRDTTVSLDERPAPSCRSNVKGEESVATGLYLVDGGSVMVAYGGRHIPIPRAQYKANGYRPPLEQLLVQPASARKPRVRCEIGSPVSAGTSQAGTASLSVTISRAAMRS